MTAIISIILSILFFIGGLIPFIANGLIEQELYRYLNYPKKVEVKIKNVPSYEIFWGNCEQIFINIDCYNFNGLIIDNIELLGQNINLKNLEAKDNLNFEINLKIKEQNINNYLQTLDLSYIENLISQIFNILIKIKINKVNLKDDNRFEVIGQVLKPSQFDFKFSAQVNLVSDKKINILYPELILGNNGVPHLLLDYVVNIINSTFELQSLLPEVIDYRIKNIEFTNGLINIKSSININK